MGQNLPGEPETRSDCIRIRIIAPESVAHASNASWRSARKIGSHKIACQTSAWRGIWVGLGAIKARVSAQLISELTEPFVSYPHIECQRPADLVLILRERCGLPHPILTIQQSKNVDGSKDVAECFSTVLTGIET